MRPHAGRLGILEGLIEALANLYRDLADAIRQDSSAAGSRDYICGAESAVRSMALVEGAATAAGFAWMPLNIFGASGV